jgi:hypothetical protein
MAQHNVCREKVLLCATALKLAFNLFDLDDGEKKSDGGNEQMRQATQTDRSE